MHIQISGNYSYDRVYDEVCLHTRLEDTKSTRCLTAFLFSSLFFLIGVKTYKTLRSLVHGALNKILPSAVSDDVWPNKR